MSSAPGDFPDESLERIGLGASLGGNLGRSYESAAIGVGLGAFKEWLAHRKEKK